ncbi:MAG: DinB family protein [Ignavibacteriae bacterium]|nr:DinB family protein [Ignavibacteriota bacterium]
MTIPQFLSYVDYLVKSTDHLFQQVPPDKIDWKPTETSFTAGQQMAHIVGAMGVYCGGFTKGEWGSATMRERFMMNRHTPSLNVEEACAQLKVQHAEFIRRVNELSEEDFAAGEIFAPQFNGKVPRWRAALLFIEHHINHKAELFMYLKILGVKVHTGHLYRGMQ